MSRESLWELGLQSIKELESEEGILASGRGEAYGCLFGRDSLITALELLHSYEQSKDEYFLLLVEKILRSLSNLQGRHTLLESGEEPGKIIHEYRPERHEHLTQLAEDPWFVYPEGVMRNYDTVDATPLFLMAVYRYAHVECPKESRKARDRFVTTLMPSVRAALAWLHTYTDTGSGFLTYSFHTDRKFGGLKVQSWMDSTESLFYEESSARPPYPIAPLEAQAYAWAAFKMWGEDDPAARLKKKFNDAFVLRGPRSVTLAFALDGEGRPLTAARSSMGHVLWAAHAGECILDQEHIPAVRNRILARDLFVPKAGVRTLSMRSLHYDPMSYHNGSIWPHDTAMLAEGLANFGYGSDARRVRDALMYAYEHFKTPIELFSYKRGIREYEAPSGQKACRVQAWSAASLLSILASEGR